MSVDIITGLEVYRHARKPLPRRTGGYHKVKTRYDRRRDKKEFEKVMLNW